MSPPGKLFARVDDTDDDFPLDNTAYGVIEPPRKVKVVLVTAGNEFLERFMQTAVDIGAIEGKVIAPEFYNAALPADLFIFDNSMVIPAAEKLPPADVIMFRPNAPASGGTADIAGFKVSHVIDNPVVLQWKREDPVMQQLNLGDLHIFRALLMDKDPGAVELVGLAGGAAGGVQGFWAGAAVLRGLQSADGKQLGPVALADHVHAERRRADARTATSSACRR